MNVHDDDHGEVDLTGLPREMPPPRGLEERVVTRLAERGLLARRGARRWMLPLAAALVGLTGGWLLRGGAEGPTRPSEEPLFLLLLSGEPTTAHSESERVSIYRAWGAELATRGRLAGAQKLKDEGLVLAEGGDGPARALEVAAETPSGFFLVRAASLAEAEAIARSCPHVQFGGRVTVRPVDPV